jgi:hypothetical protein
MHDAVAAESRTVSFGARAGRVEDTETDAELMLEDWCCEERPLITRLVICIKEVCRCEVQRS